MKETRRLACGLGRWSPKERKQRTALLSTLTHLALCRGSSSIFTHGVTLMGLKKQQQKKKNTQSLQYSSSDLLPALREDWLSHRLYVSPPPCCASPGTLEAEQLHTPRDAYSSSCPSPPSPPSAGKQPSDVLLPLLQKPVLEEKKGNISPQRQTHPPHTESGSSFLKAYFDIPESPVLEQNIVRVGLSKQTHLHLQHIYKRVTSCYCRWVEAGNGGKQSRKQGNCSGSF